MRKTTIILVVLVLLLLPSCSLKNESDIQNLGGDTPAVSPSGGADNDSETISPYVVDGKFDHFDPSQYRDNLSDERISIDALRESYSEDCNYIINNPRKEFSFKNCVAESFPDMENIRPVYEEIEEAGNREAWDLIVYWLKKMNIYDEIDPDKEIVNCAVNYPEDSPEYKEGKHPTAKETWDETSGYMYAFLNKDYGYVQVLGSAVSILDTGVMASYHESCSGEKMNRTLSVYGMFDNELVDAGTLEEMKDKEYELIDGKMSVGKAAEYVEEFWNSNCPSNLENIKPDVFYVAVYRLDDKYYYRFNIRRKIDNVLYSVDQTGSRTNYVEEFMLTGDTMIAYVADSSGVCGFFGQNGTSDDTLYLEPQTEMVGVKTAVEHIYEVMADEFVCSIDKIDFVYVKYTAHKMSDKGNPMILYVPAWEFKGISEYTGRIIKIYVDALTGEVGFYENNEDWVYIKPEG